MKERNVLRKKSPNFIFCQYLLQASATVERIQSEKLVHCVKTEQQHSSPCARNESLLQPEENFNLFNVSTLNLSRNREVDVT